MTTHFFYKELKDLTDDDIFGELKRHLSWSGGKSYVPGAYGLFSEADHYAYDAWRYIDYVAFYAGNDPRTPEQWCEFHLKKYEEEGKPELVEKTKMYIELLKGVLEKYNESKRTV